jgi:arylsulfatase
LRDGDWKLVSFRRQPWELYNLALDRTESRDLAREHPERVARMAAQWHDLTANVLQAPAGECAPVAETATEKRHPEWTDFSSPDASSARRREPRRSRQQAGRPGRIRARLGTTLSIVGKQLVLQCKGTDPGLAFDVLPAMPDAGPYTLEFRVQSRARGDGEIYWTTAPETPLPQGGHLVFPVKHANQWQDIKLEIPETRRLYALRLDPCGGEGEARVEGLRLKDASARTLASWP